MPTRQLAVSKRANVDNIAVSVNNCHIKFSWARWEGAGGPGGITRLPAIDISDHVGPDRISGGDGSSGQT